MRSAAVLVAAVLASPWTSVAQGGAPGAEIRGVIRSSEGLSPVAYANIQIPGRRISGWTDDRGSYRIEGLPEGRWEVRIVHPGHDSLRLDVHLAADRRLVLDLTLRARPGPPVEPLGDFEPFTVDFTLPALLNREEVTSLIEAAYPPRLVAAGVAGETVLRLWLDERGQVVRSEVYGTSGHAALDSIAGEVAGRMRFQPAKNRADPIRVIVLIPVVFAAPGQGGPEG